MFEHLDDPATAESRHLFEPCGAVLGRAAPACAGGRLASALGALVVCALAMGVVIGVVVSGPTPSQTFAAFDSETGLLAAGTPVPSSDLASVVFVGDVHGFARGRARRADPAGGLHRRRRHVDRRRSQPAG